MESEQQHKSLQSRPKRVKQQRKNITWQSRQPYLKEANISHASVRWLGYIMAFLAGSINAGGFFAVARYTSHVSGELSHGADMLYLGEWQIAITSFLMVFSFMLGATHAAWTILWAKRQRFRSSYGISMWLEAFYMLVFGLMGAVLASWQWGFVPIAMMLLGFIMGMHNTVLTILSAGTIRTTHMTGFATDIGIEMAKVMHSRKSMRKSADVTVNMPKIKLYAGTIVSFVAGGVVGAWGFRYMGYRFTLPVALILFLLGLGSIGYDVKVRFRVYLRYRRLQKLKQAGTDNAKAPTKQE